MSDTIDAKNDAKSVQADIKPSSDLPSGQVAKFSLAAGVLVEDQGKILILQELKSDPKYGKVANAYAFPMGHIRVEENPLDAALREVKEETGYEVELLYILGFYLVKGAMGVAFRGKLLPKPQTPKTAEGETSNLQWLTPQEILALPNLRPAVAEVITDYLAGNAYSLNFFRDCR